jgi:hypothetical protein
LNGKRIENAQNILDWAIESLDLSIKCMVINYKDEKYKVQFFTRENKLIKALGFNISEEWIRDTIPMKDEIHDELKSLLKDLEQEARREMRNLNGDV